MSLEAEADDNDQGIAIRNQRRLACPQFAPPLLLRSEFLVSASIGPNPMSKLEKAADESAVGDVTHN